MCVLGDSCLVVLVVAYFIIYLYRVDASKDEKFGALSSSQYDLVVLAAAVLYQGVIIICLVTCRSILCSGFIMPFFSLVELFHLNIHSYEDGFWFSFISYLLHFCSSW